MKTLLPPNSTKLELKLSETLNLATELTVEIKKLATPQYIPSQFLPHIGWQNSVDRWNRKWSEEFKKQQIKIAFDLHRKKGTVSALRSVAQSFGFYLQIQEWWQQNNATAGTFSLDIEMNNQSFEQDDYNNFIDLINDNKPLTRHLTSINFKAKAITTQVQLSSSMYDGHITTIYPSVPRLEAHLNTPSAHFDHQITSIFPQV